MRGVVLLVCTCACKQVFGLHEPLTSDATADGAITPRDAQVCWSVPQLALDFCLTEPLSGNVAFDHDQTLTTDDDTASGVACAQTSTPGLCVIAGDTITISPTSVLAVQGTRPLVLVANAIVVGGRIDVASHRGGKRGPGGDAAACAPGSTPVSRGGGGGGSFGTKGGDGGAQDGVGGSGGNAGAAVAAINSFRGGCPGTDGGGTVGHGSGGGAIALLGGQINLATMSVINASGAGGVAGGVDDGGNGAGSGGMIVFQSMQLGAADGCQVFANGGGGGGAGSDTQAGQHGADPLLATSGGAGGQGAGSDAGDGGDGYPASANARNGVTGGAAAAGGGGGGGGAGVIRIYGSSQPANSGFSPPPNP